MPKAFPFWTAAPAAIFLLCANFTCTTPSAAKSESPAVPPSAEVIQNGTHFLVRLDQEMNTGQDKIRSNFEVITMESLETSKGRVVPAGARIHGHISRIEP